MGIAYTEGKSLATNLLNDLRAAIVASSDWSRVGGPDGTTDTVILTTTAASIVGATTLTFTSGTPATAGVVVGSMVRIGSGNGVAEWRAVTAVAATTITVAALTFAHASGTSVYWGAEAYRATTTRGVQMYFDLANGPLVTNYNGPQLCFYSEDQGGRPAVNATYNPTARYLNAKGEATGTVSTNFIYWWVSVSKEHVFIMVEGPRPSEVGADSANYGSVRTYMFMCDLVPYFTSVQDPTPAVVFYASPENRYKSIAAFSHKAQVTKNVAGDRLGNSGYLTTLDMPGFSGGLMSNRFGLDGSLFLSPYVYMDDLDGFRGRLSHLFYAGPSHAYGDWSSSPEEQVLANTFTTYNGIKYKILQVGRDNNVNNGAIFGPLGFQSAQTGNPNAVAGQLVAVPYSAA